MTRDRLENAMRRLHSDALANTTIDVYEPSLSYSAGDGYSLTYPSTVAATYEARVESPDDVTDRERAGTTGELDAIVRVRDDTNQQWTGFGEDGQAPARIEDTSDGTRYEVQGVTDEKDGLTTLAVTEV